MPARWLSRYSARFRVLATGLPRRGMNLRLRATGMARQRLAMRDRSYSRGDNETDHKTSGAGPGEQVYNADACNPGRLLDLLVCRLDFSDESRLASRLNLDWRLIAGIHAGKVAISGTMLMIMREATGVTLDELQRTLRAGEEPAWMPRRPSVTYKA